MRTSLYLHLKTQVSNRIVTCDQYLQLETAEETTLVGGEDKKISKAEFQVKILSVSMTADKIDIVVTPIIIQIGGRKYIFEILQVTQNSFYATQEEHSDVIVKLALVNIL